MGGVDLSLSAGSQKRKLSATFCGGASGDWCADHYAQTSNSDAWPSNWTRVSLYTSKDLCEALKWPPAPSGWPSEKNKEERRSLRDRVKLWPSERYHMLPAALQPDELIAHAAVRRNPAHFLEVPSRRPGLPKLCSSLHFSSPEMIDEIVAIQ
jgi:hypothetical protein